VPILRRFGSVGDKVHTEGKNRKNYRTSGWFVRLSGLKARLGPSVRLQFARVVGSDDEEKVYASKINMGLMSRMFGGNIAEVMEVRLSGMKMRYIPAL